MAHTYDKQAKSGREVAASRYGKSKAPNIRTGPLIAAAEDIDLPHSDYNAAEARQVNETGKVRK